MVMVGWSIPPAGKARVGGSWGLEGGDEAEEGGAGAGGGAVQGGVVLGGAVDLGAVGSDNLESKHVFTCRAEHLAVPAVPALQQIAAEANAFAMARRKEQ